MMMMMVMMVNMRVTVMMTMKPPFWKRKWDSDEETDVTRRLVNLLLRRVCSVTHKQQHTRTHTRARTHTHTHTHTQLDQGCCDCNLLLLTVHEVIRVPQTTEVKVQQEPDRTHKHKTYQGKQTEPNRTQQNPTELNRTQQNPTELNRTRPTQHPVSIRRWNSFRPQTVFDSCWLKKHKVLAHEY